MSNPNDFGTLIVDGEIWLVAPCMGPIVDDSEQRHAIYLDRARRTIFVDENLPAAEAAIAIAQVSNLLHGRRERRRSNPAARLCFN